MKNLAEGKNARGAIKSASKVLAWALGVMLIVAGIVPGFAAESKASNQNGEKVVVSDSTTKKPEDSVKERERKANPVILKDKCYEMRRKKAIKCKKTIRIQRPVKRGVTYNLNKSGNVKAIKDNDGNINVTATNTLGDMKIDRQKWIDMVVALGGEYSPTSDSDIGLTWSNDKRTFNFNTNGIRLPDNSHTLFSGFKGPILGCGKLNTSNVTNMRGMFLTTEEANPDVLNWDTSNVTNMYAMFLCAEKANPDVSKWNTSKVTDMARMFYNAKEANPDVSKWNTSNVTAMVEMFCGAEKANPDVLKWNTSKVTDMAYMFSGAEEANPDVSKWNTSNVIDMAGMFYDAKEANPDVSKWNTSKVTDMEEMFYGAKKANPDVSKWNTSKVTDMARMFYNAKEANPDVSKWNTSKVTNMAWMFRNTFNADPDVSKWNTSRVVLMNNMFQGAWMADPDVSKWNTSKVINMARMFNFARLANPDVSNWNTSNVTDMAEMFFWSNNVNPDVSNWNTSKVKDMQFMFCNASRAEPNVSHWNTSNVTNMKRMFTNTAAVSLNLSKWKLNKKLLNTSENMANMFSGCNKLKCLKTPAGLRTSIRIAEGDFKIVKLKKYNQVMIEKESQSLNDEYEINKDGDSEAIYHIYNKNVYAGVTFDKNGGDTESWFNHEIVEKGKTFSEGGGRFPSQKPTKKEYVCIGWAKDAKAAKPDIIKNTAVDEDMTAYAVYKLGVPKLKMKVRVKKIRKGRKRIKVRVLTLRFRPSKAASGYEAKVVIRGKVRKIKLKKGRKKLKGFIVGKIVLPRRGKGFLYFRGFKKIKGKKHYGVQIKKLIK